MRNHTFQVGKLYLGHFSNAAIRGRILNPSAYAKLLRASIQCRLSIEFRSEVDLFGITLWRMQGLMKHDYMQGDLNQFLHYIWSVAARTSQTSTTLLICATWRGPSAMPRTSSWRANAQHGLREAARDL